MKSPLFGSCRTALFAAFVGFGLLTSQAQAAVIYASDFSGGATSINGTAPGTANAFAGGSASATWISNSQYLANGTVTTPTSGGSALLAFTPQAGYIYSLSGTVTTDTAGGWLSLGFSQNANINANFYGATNNGSAWILKHPNSSEQFFSDSTTAAGGAAIAGTVTLGVVLNTTAAQWTAEWFVNGSKVGSTYTYTTNPTINYVGFSKSVTSGTIDDFSFSAVPEPSIASLGVLAAMMVIGRRRRTA